ncbi:MAG: hypothetical protein AAGU12_12135 [Clostridiales bacterium]
MRTKIMLALLLVASLLLGGCNEKVGSQSEPTKKEQTFYVWISVAVTSSEPVKAYADCMREEDRKKMDEREAVTFDDLDFLAVPAYTREGEKLEMDGSVTVYITDENKTSITIPVKGSYIVDDDLTPAALETYYLRYYNGELTEYSPPKY